MIMYIGRAGTKPRILFVGIVLLLCAVGLGQETKKPFVVVQSIHTFPPPDLSAYGIPYQPVVYQNTVLVPNTDDIQQEAKLRPVSGTWKKGPLPTVIDIERWPVTGQEPSVRAQSVKRLIQAMQTIRQMRPDLQFGYYGLMPDRVYWPLVGATPSSMAEKARWQHDNTMSKKELAPYVDAVYPSLYTFYPDQKGWVTFATGMLQEARQFGKPVYCFLWPRYQKPPHEVIPADYWRLQLETCRKHADGVVIYDETTFNPNEAWWKETLSFVATLNAQGATSQAKDPSSKH